MSSSNHPTSDIDDVFSSNFLNYTPTSPNYFPASLRNISPDSSDNLSKYLLASLAISPFQDNHLRGLYPRKRLRLRLEWNCSIDISRFASTHLRDFFMPGRELCGAIKKIGSIGLSPALPSPRTLERARKGLLLVTLPVWLEMNKVTKKPMARSGEDLKMAKLMMSSPNHSTSNIEDAFSSMNILNYTSVSSDYFPASSKSSSFNSSENFKDNMIPPIVSPLYNNPCLKDVQAFYAKESPIPSPDPITPLAILTPSLIFEIGKSSIKEHLKHHEKQIEDILYYLEELSFHHIEKMEERLVNGWIIIPRDFDEVKTKLKEARTQILELQKKHMGQRDKIAFVRFRISDLEMTLEDIQDRHQLYMKNLMGHTS
ncbi:hypothetical protein Tco_1503002 [Tanacetum coccineum]